MQLKKLGEYAMKISRKELASRYGIDLSAGKYDIKLLENVYTINTIKDDTEGCILVGSSNDRNDDDWVGGSKVALAQLITKLSQVKGAVVLDVV